MGDSYSILANWYDELMGDFDYSKLSEFCCDAINKYSPNIPKQILDLGCGTGSLSVLMAKKGYDVTGIDLSNEMLALASAKANNLNLKIKYACEDMAYLDVGHGYGAAICSLDGLNYLLDKESLSSCISRVYSSLADGGLFIFDVNSEFRYKTIYADNSYVYDMGELFLVWRNYYKSSTGKCNFYLTFFEKNGKQWTRRDEVQVQKYHSEKALNKILTETGFEIMSISSGPDKLESFNKDEKKYFICKK
ncbi:MAG: class I SAM-dependent methyltransferase [Clostridiales bacterium]|nr:class I SAM-dependent methyltransferase [Clostridiales bacterium]